MTHASRTLALAAALAVAAVAAALLAGGMLVGEAGATSATAAGKKKGPRVVTKTTSITGADATQRGTVKCPKGMAPYGGGMSASPGPSADGEGVYPRSYERLGVQKGWHVTFGLVDPSPGFTLAYGVTLQVVCGAQVRNLKSPHKTTSVAPGETKTVIAKCPGKRRLIGGGYQRTSFNSFGGTVPTESHAVSQKHWRVSGQAGGKFGSQMTAIGYCLPISKKHVKPVSASTTVAPGATGAVTTPRCRGGRKLVNGGFETSPPGAMYFGDGIINRNQTWTVTGFNRTALNAVLTAHGYCLSKAVLKGKVK